MRLVLVSLAALLLAQDPSPADKVRQLVEQLQSDSVVEADDAFNRLVALGPDALADVKSHLDKVSPDVKARLTAAVAKIERQVKAREALGPPLKVTLKAEKRPLPEVLEEFKRVSGQPLAWKDIPSDPVSVDLKGELFWPALNALCAAHGNITWDVAEKEIRISRGKHRKRPTAAMGNLAVVLERIESTVHVNEPGGTMPATYLTARLVWIAGRAPRDAHFEVSVFNDDQGTSLLDADLEEEEREFFRDGELAGTFHFGGDAAVDDAATAIAELTGVARVQYVLEWKPVLSIDEPVKKPGTAHKSGDWTFQLESIEAKGDRVEATLTVSWSGDESLPFGYEDIAIVDEAGRRHPGRPQDRGMFQFTEGDGENSEYFMVAFDLPAGAKAAKLEVRMPADHEELKLPFTFKGIALP